MPDKRSVLVIGAGDATGGAIARRFAREGLAAAVTRRAPASSPVISSHTRPLIIRTVRSLPKPRSCTRKA